MAQNQNKPEKLNLIAETLAQMQAKMVPEWVKAENFEEIVKNKLRQFEKIVAFKASPALAPGENYATLILRISIDAQLKDKSISKLSYMLKLPHDNEQMRQMLNIYNFFTNENMAFQTILPELEDMYNEAGVNIRFGPIGKKFSKDFGDYVLMEDLGVDGFRNANRLECLDMAHAELVLEKLAKYHAASAVRVAEKGPYPSQFMDGMDNEGGRQIWASMINSFRDPFLNNLGNFENGERYRKSLVRWFDNLDNETNFLLKRNNEVFNVLSHGDCWSNNILFKYSDDGKPIDIIFVDFQLPRWTTPVQDILYFIMSSTQADIKLSKFNYFFRFYYNHLIENLKLLKYPKEMPTLSDLHIQAQKVGSWGVITAVMVLPIILLDASENSKFENFMSAEEAGMAFKDAVYKNKRYEQYINDLLPWFYERGMINSE